jgi:signal transduction histidine kinase
MASVSKHSGRLFRKYAVILVLLVGGALLTSGLIELYFSYQENKKGQADIQQEKATTAATRIEQFIDEIERRVRQTAETPRAAGGVGLDERYIDYLRLLKDVSPITEIAYVDRVGKEQLQVSRLAVSVIGSQADLSGEAKFQETKARNVYFSPVYFRDESEPYLTIAVAEREPDAGVVAVAVNLKFIQDVVSRIKIGTAGRSYVVDSNGILVAHPDISLVLRKTDLSSLSQVQAALAASLDPAKQQVAATSARDFQGQRVLTAYRSIEPLGWQVFVEQPLNEAYAPLYSSMLRTIVILLAALALAVLTSLFLARKMVTPIQTLQAAAARIGAGALDQRIDIRTGDELGDLSKEFNLMAAQLQESYANLEQKVEERTAALAAVNQELEAFSYSVSHDLRAPLRSIDGFSQALLEDYEAKLDTQGKDYLQRVRSASQRMGQLIDDMLNLSRVTRTEIRRETVDLSALAHTVAAGLQKAQPQRDATFVIAEGLVANGDEGLLRVALENLLGNAWKFTGKRPDTRIEFGAIEQNGTKAYMVRDNGAGFDMAYADKLFKTFQRLHEVAEFEGTGIGLATVQRIIRRHGGSVWAEGAVDQGATFYFTLN